MSNERAASSVGAKSEPGRVLQHSSHRVGSDAAAMSSDEILPVKSIPVPSSAIPG
jgi:hypothetical protein